MLFSGAVKGVKADKLLKHWIPMCETWAFNIERYTRLAQNNKRLPYDNNKPYNKTERANVGMLAGAAWSCGNIALEEFQFDKADGKGRVDLWLCNENYKDEYVEAKFNRTSIKGKYLAKIKDTLDAAIEDAKRSKGKNDFSFVGVAFIILTVKKQELNVVLELLEQAISEIDKEIDNDLLAWCFPEQDLKHIHPNGLIAPGVIMLGKCA